jgi:regulator of replication initiation timing
MKDDSEAAGAPISQKDLDQILTRVSALAETPGAAVVGQCAQDITSLVEAVRRLREDGESLREENERLREALQRTEV